MLEQTLTFGSHNNNNNKYQMCHHYQRTSCCKSADFVRRSELGSVIGFEYTEWNFVERSLKQQKSLLKKLAAHAKNSPQNVYKSFTSWVQRKLTFLAPLTPNIEDLLKECEESINVELLPNLLKNPAHNQKYLDIKVA